MLEHILKRLDPFTHLDRDALTTLAQHARLVRLAAGRHIRAGGLSCDWLGYVLEGSLRLAGARHAAGEVVAGTAAARRPFLGGTCPAVAACTLTASRVLWVNVAPVAFLLESAPVAGMALAWLDDEPAPAGWRERFLQRGLHAGAPSLLKRLFTAFESVSIEGDEHVFEAGAPGREFYVVAEGRIEIRRPEGGCFPLGPGDAFGEEAILGDGRRNASAYAVQRGRLMRLDEASFRSVLVPALVRSTTREALEPGTVVIDLDGPMRGCDDPRPHLARVPRAVPVVIAGATRVRRSRWAFLAARAGLTVAMLER